MKLTGADPGILKGGVASSNFLQKKKKKKKGGGGGGSNPTTYSGQFVLEIFSKKGRDLPWLALKYMYAAMNLKYVCIIIILCSCKPTES